MSALRASHLGSSAQTVGTQPSVFDVVSQESLMKALKPALGHLIKFLSMSTQGKVQIVQKYFDEFYLLFDLLLQNQYLKSYGGSFSENFYSMKRIVQKTGQAPSEGLSRLRSLAVLVLWPYVHDKLDKLHGKLTDTNSQTDGGGQQTLKSRLRKIFIQCWPWIKTLLSTASTILQLLYVINRSSIHSPMLWLSGTRLEKLTPDDIATFEAIPMHLQQSGIVNRLWRFVLSLPGICSRLFGYGLFFVQFLDFMYNSDMGAQMKKANSQWTPPPAPHTMLTEANVLNLDTHKCPLCLKQRVNDTALSVSGYVFCFSCIEAYVRQYQSCPITKISCTTKQLIRLYVQ